MCVVPPTYSVSRYIIISIEGTTYCISCNVFLCMSDYGTYTSNFSTFCHDTYKYPMYRYIIFHISTSTLTICCLSLITLKSLTSLFMYVSLYKHYKINLPTTHVFIKISIYKMKKPIGSIVAFVMMYSIYD